MKKILLVDDENTILDILEDYLSNYYEVITCNNPINVKNLIEEHKFSVVISDYNMPGIDGETLSKEINGKSGIGFILLSGYDDIDELMVHPNINMVHQKPVNLRTLKKDIDMISEGY